MISSALVTMLLVAANPTAQARESYARCLKDFVREGVEKKLEAAAFESGFAAACRDKEAAFKNARVTADVAMGIKRAAAEKGLAEEIADYRSMAKEDFVDAVKTSAPQP